MGPDVACLPAEDIDQVEKTRSDAANCAENERRVARAGVVEVCCERKRCVGRLLLEGVANGNGSAKMSSVTTAMRS